MYSCIEFDALNSFADHFGKHVLCTAVHRATSVITTSPLREVTKQSCDCEDTKLCITKRVILLNKKARKIVEAGDDPALVISYTPYEILHFVYLQFRFR